MDAVRKETYPLLGQLLIGLLALLSGFIHSTTCQNACQRRHLKSQLNNFTFGELTCYCVPPALLASKSAGAICEQRQCP